MTTTGTTATGTTAGLRLKQRQGWFAAGSGFRQGVRVLSDGAFKLLVWICLEARRDSGELDATHKELAHALGKSKRTIGQWVAELQSKGACHVRAGINQYEPSRFRISDSYWPYHRDLSPNPHQPSKHKPHQGSQAHQGSPHNSSDQYVATVRGWFLDLECAKGTFDAADETFARELQQRGVPLQTVENGLLLGAARKYQSWLAGTGSSPICSLRYFDLVIQEAEHMPFSDDYRRFLRGKLRTYAARSARSGPAPQGRQLHRTATGPAALADALQVPKINQQGKHRQTKGGDVR